MKFMENIYACGGLTHLVFFFYFNTLFAHA